LRLPDLEHAKAAVLNCLTSADAQPEYRHVIDEFVDWYCSEPRLAIWNPCTCLQEPLTCAWALCGDSRTKLPIAVCSVRTSRLAFGESMV
jgi:hypothetical protein